MLYALLQVRSASAALKLRDYQAFSRVFTGSTGAFNDPTRLTRWTRGFLYAHVAIAVYGLCNRVFEGSLELPPAAAGAAIAIQIVAFYGTVILVPLWTHRANHNARQLGATDMTFTPGWAAGWYFLPPGLLWKPCLVMKEIWQASVDPVEWRGHHGSPLIGWWWTMWVATTWGELLLWGLAVVALEPGDAQVVESAAALVSRLLHVPLTLLLLTIITKVHNMQMKHYRNQSEDATR